MRGKAVHEERLWTSDGHDFAIHSIRFERTLFSVTFRLTHAGPGVGVDSERALNGTDVVGDLDACAGAHAASNALTDHGAIGLEALGRDHRDSKAEDGCRLNERMADVVAVANPRESRVIEMKAAFDKRLQVSERLAGMVHVAQCVDDWNARGCRKVNHRGVRVHARHDGMAPALEVFAVIADGFAGAERCFAVVKVNGLAAQAKHSNFETHTRS